MGIQKPDLRHMPLTLRCARQVGACWQDQGAHRTIALAGNSILNGFSLLHFCSAMAVFEPKLPILDRIKCYERVGHRRAEMIPKGLGDQFGSLPIWS